MDRVEKRLPAWEEGPDEGMSPPKPKFFNLSSGLTTGTRSSELPSKVELHALVPAEVRLGTTQLMIAFLLDEKYSSWRWLYNRACENIEIRNKEMPLSLETCFSLTRTANDSVPQYSKEASYAFREWLEQQVGTSLVQPDCVVRETNVADSYIQMIREQRQKVATARAVYIAAQEDLPYPLFEVTYEERLMQRVERKLQGIDAGDLITPFPVKKELTPEEAEAEARRKSLLSRSDQELEKVHPERIEFLGFVFESYKYGTGYQARKLEKEYANAHPQKRVDGEAPRWYKSRARRPEAEAPKYDKDLLLRLCGCL